MFSAMAHTKPKPGLGYDDAGDRQCSDSEEKYSDAGWHRGVDVDGEFEVGGQGRGQRYHNCHGPGAGNGADVSGAS
jgi:hypothetical protein